MKPLSQRGLNTTEIVPPRLSKINFIFENVKFVKCYSISSITESYIYLLKVIYIAINILHKDVQLLVRLVLNVRKVFISLNYSYKWRSSMLSKISQNASYTAITNDI